MRRLPAVAVAGYVAGVVLGTAVCHLGWALVSHESRFRL